MAYGKYKWRIAGFVFKAICALIIAAIVILLVVRIIDSSHDPREMNTIIANDRLAAAYSERGKDLDIFSQEHSIFTRGDNNYGYFAVTQSIIIRDIDQVQFVLRYNNSTLKYTKEDYKLSEIPARDANVYDVTLTIMYDLTPENSEDNDGKTPGAVEFKRFFASDMVSAQKTLYNYRKFVFDDIEIDDSVIAVYADFYYVGDVNYDEKPYGSLLIYHNEEDEIKYSLTQDDIKAIESYLGN